jgi:hypothetical protein
MAVTWEVVADWEYRFGAVRIAIAKGTRLVSRDSGKTFRFEGMGALTVLAHDEVLRLAHEGVVREAV